MGPALPCFYGNWAGLESALAKAALSQLRACGLEDTQSPEQGLSAAAPGSAHAPMTCTREHTHADMCTQLGPGPWVCWDLAPLPPLGACSGGCGEPAQPCSDPVSWARSPCLGGRCCWASTACMPWARGSFLGASGWLDVRGLGCSLGIHEASARAHRHVHVHVLKGVSPCVPLRAPGPH